MPAILQARRIELIDAQGHAAIVLESKPAENSLVVWGPDHEHAAVLVSQSSKASLMLLKNKEAPEVFAQAAEDGGQLGVTNGVGGIGGTGRESLNLVGGSHGTALLQNIDGRPQSHLSFNKEGAELELKRLPARVRQDSWVHRVAGGWRFLPRTAKRSGRLPPLRWNRSKPVANFS